MRDRHGPAPLAGQVQTQRVTGVDMRQPSGAGPELQDGIADPDDRIILVAVGDLNGVPARDLTGLQAGYAVQLAAAQGATRVRDRLGAAGMPAAPR